MLTLKTCIVLVQVYNSDFQGCFFFFFPPLKNKSLYNRASEHQNDFCHFSKLHDNKRSQAGSSSLVFNKIIWFRTEKLNLKVTTKSIFLHCIIQNISLDSHPILQQSEQVSKLTQVTHGTCSFLNTTNFVGGGNNKGNEGEQ